ncbi:MAG: SMP-30/gluconolactonase/LRE family protein [Bacteroidetes bacterium]|nr:SMP-30/gluconolactonase/LRE family protein [Bacteroidota bacterium]
MQASLLYKSNNILAEGPYWHEGRQSFFWVDIDGKKFHEYRWKSGETKQWLLDYRPSLIAEPVYGNYLLLGIEGGLTAFDLEKESLEWRADIEKEIPANRTNDGGCDPYGRLWIGTMHREFHKGKGSLYSIEHDLTIKKKLDNVTISNGIVWSQDGTRMYYIDSPTKTVQCFLFDKETGDLQFEKIVITIKEGSPDGMCMDEEGMLWIAQWDAFGVYRWNPETGTLLDKIELPVPQVSSCAFGGENMDHLFITTARENMDKETLEKYPLSGNVFIAKPGVKGAKVHKFGKQNV